MPAYHIRNLFCTNLKLITHTPDGFDVAVDGIGLYFLAQGADMHINDVAVSIVIVAPDFIHQDFARIDPVGRSCEQGQDVELGRRQHDLDMVDLDATRQQINGETGETQGRFAIGCPFLFARLLALARRADTPQDGAHAAHQLARAKGFDDIIIRANVQPRNAVVLVSTRGEHQNRGFRPGPDATAHLKAIQRGQHNIEYDQVGMLAGVQSQAVRAIFRHHYFIARIFQIQVQQMNNTVFVFNNQYFLSHSIELHRSESLLLWYHIHLLKTRLWRAFCLSTGRS